jgi:glycosyltransferase involved in cell wall biosynthesis
VGWNVVTRLAKFHDVTVLYGDIGKEQVYREQIEEWTEKNGEINGLTFCYVPQGKLGHLIHQLSVRVRPLHFLYYWAYRCWLKQAYKKALLLLSEIHFDVSHQLTFVSCREPGYLWKLPISFVWGPINGADNIPWKYFGGLSFGAKFRYGFRNIINSIQVVGSKTVRAAAHASSSIWAVTDADLKMVDRWGERAEQMTETGVILQEGARPRYFDDTRPLRVVWSGLLEGRKALHLLIKAIARLDGSGKRIELWILGEGPEASRWKKLAVNLGIEERVVWYGRLPLSEAQSLMAEADVFVFSSIKEASSTVVMEALACGLPVICHDTCGMGHVVNASCGIKIPLKSPKISIAGFSAALRNLLDNPERIAQLSAGALERGQLFSWDKKVEHIAKCYLKEKQETEFVRWAKPN